MIEIQSSREELEMNMAPMIDVVFLLIIFFLTATTFSEKEREQDVLLPTNRTPKSLSRALDDNIIVNVIESGELRVQGSPMQHTQLQTFLKTEKDRSPRPIKVLVRADKRTAYGNVAIALETIERAGIQRPYIVTKLVDMKE